MRRPGMLFESCSEVERRCIRVVLPRSRARDRLDPWQESWPEPTRGPQQRPRSTEVVLCQEAGGWLSLALRAREGLVRRTQLLGSLAGSPDCQIYLSFSGHAAKKGQDGHPNKGGSQLTDANFKGVALFPTAAGRGSLMKGDIRAAHHTHDASCRDKSRDIFGLAVAVCSVQC